MTTTPATDRTRELLARARAAEDERDALARQVTSMQLKINRLQSGDRDEAMQQLQSALSVRDAQLQAAQDANALLTRQVADLQRQLKRASLVEPDPDAQRERDRGAAAITALREANEALRAQVDVLQRANKTLASGEGQRE